MLKITSLAVRQRIPRILTSEIRNVHQEKTLVLEKETQEITIPVPWGHIAGKWWGPTDVTPLLGLHGWQDNACTWDRLAPMLPPDISLLAIDCPGHGLSSHYSPGHPYRLMDQLFIIRRIVHHFGWDKISLLAHSMGGVQSFIYASVYPDQVDNLIAVDAFKPLSINPDTEIEKLGPEIDKFLDLDNQDESIKPSYSYDEMVEKLYHGMVRNSLTKESCKILLKRGMAKSGDGYYFTRDSRLKSARLTGWLHDYILELASRITCNVLFIKAVPGLLYEEPEITSETLEVIKKSAKRFEYHVVEGLHHVHLNNPERVAPIVINFLKSTENGSSGIATGSLMPQTNNAQDSSFKFL